MLFQLGTLTISSLGPFNADAVAEEFGSDFAVKPVVGALQPREFMGPADNHMTLSGTLLVDLFARNRQDTGLSGIETLRTVTGSGEPQPLVRGDGVNLGSWLVEKVSTKSAKLDLQGVGRVVSYDISLVRSPTAATPAALVNMLESLFQ